jgi:hypothetical protein
MPFLSGIHARLHGRPGSPLPHPSSPTPQHHGLFLRHPLLWCLSILVPLGVLLLSTGPAFAAIPAPAPGPGDPPDRQPANQTICIQHAEVIAQPHTLTSHSALPWLPSITIPLPNQDYVPIVDTQGTTLGQLTLYRSHTCPGAFYATVSTSSPVDITAEVISVQSGAWIYQDTDAPAWDITPDPNVVIFSPLYRGSPGDQVCAQGMITTSQSFQAFACTPMHTNFVPLTGN